MDIRSFVFAQQGKGPYNLYTLGALFNCQVDEVSQAPLWPNYLTWFFGEGDISQALKGSYDILTVAPYQGVDFLWTLGGDIVQRDKPEDPWTIVDHEEYFMADGSHGIPEFPVEMNEGAAVVATSGTWTWRDNAGRTGTGTWKNTTRYSLDRERFTWDEEESETHDDTGGEIPYHRIRKYDKLGWIGFDDVLVPTASVRRQDYLSGL